MAGESFLLRARELLSQALELNEFGRDLGESLTGELNIGCFSFVAPFFLPALLAQFRERHPLIETTLIEKNLDDVQQSLLTGECDIAFLYDLSMSPRLSKQILATFPPYVLLPPRPSVIQKETAVAEGARPGTPNSYRSAP
jgi:DNA-binding transcriptional LysR family regulator